MPIWRSNKGIEVRTARLDMLAENHLHVLAVFSDILNDSAVFDSAASLFDTDFLAFAEFRYALYMRIILEEAKNATAILPPWDVALLLYAHLFYTTSFCDDLVQGIWGLKAVPEASLSDVLRRFSFPLVQLAGLTALEQWSDNFSSFEWDQRYPRIPYQPWMKMREGRIARLAQSRNIAAVTVRCPKCGASARCGATAWKDFRRGVQSLPCRKSSCEPISYTRLSAQFRSPWNSLSALAESIARALSGADKFLLSPELQTKAGLKEASLRYQKFIMLLSETRSLTDVHILAPKADIDLCWRTHRLMPAHYRLWCVENLGRPVEDDETGRHQIYEGGCEELTKTERMWQIAYKEPYRNLKLSLLHRMFHPRRGRVLKKSNVKENGVKAVDMPNFAYDPNAYTFAAVAADIPDRDSSISGLVGLASRGPSHESRRSRGSFVPQVENTASLSSKAQKSRRQQRHSKEVSVLPAIRSMDSIVVDSDESNEAEARRTVELQSQTGFHTTVSPALAGNGSGASTISPISPVFSAHTAHGSPDTLPDPVYESVLLPVHPETYITSSPVRSKFPQHNEVDQQRTLPDDTDADGDASAGQDVMHQNQNHESTHMDDPMVHQQFQQFQQAKSNTANAPQVSTRPESSSSARGPPPISLHQRNNIRMGLGFATRPSSTLGRPGSATRPGSAGSNHSMTGGVRSRPTSRGSINTPWVAVSAAAPASASAPTLAPMPALAPASAQGPSNNKAHKYPPNAFRNGPLWVDHSGVAGSTSKLGRKVKTRSKSTDDAQLSSTDANGYRKSYTNSQFSTGNDYTIQQNPRAMSSEGLVNVAGYPPQSTSYQGANENAGRRYSLGSNANGGTVLYYDSDDSEMMPTTTTSTPATTMTSIKSRLQVAMGSNEPAERASIEAAQRRSQEIRRWSDIMHREANANGSRYVGQSRARQYSMDEYQHAA